MVVSLPAAWASFAPILATDKKPLVEQLAPTSIAISTPLAKPQKAGVPKQKPQSRCVLGYHLPACQ